MEVIPQTQFIPLSEILCMVILDLNNKQVVATLDIIQERLNQCYKGMQIPAPPVIYDTLGTLIRERKIFHTGEGYSTTFTPHPHVKEMDILFRILIIIKYKAELHASSENDKIKK